MRAPDNDYTLAYEIAAEIHDNIYSVLTALLPPSASRDDTLRQRVFDGFEERAAKVVLDAIKLQDTMQQACLSHNYSLFFPATKEHYSANEMDVFDIGPDVTKNLATAVLSTTGSRGTVILPVMPGLRAVRASSNISLADIVVKKASVVALI